MKTDSWVGSVLWGRIGGAVLVLAAFVMQGLGVDFSAEDQQQTFGIVESVLASVGTLLVLISKYREKVKEKDVQPASVSRSGQASLGAIVLAPWIGVFILVAALLMAPFIIGGCAGQTAVEQISQQTSSPLTLSKAAYIDASDIYIDAGNSYADYKSILEESNPKLAADVKKKFTEANEALDKWGAFLILGDPTFDESETFKELRLLIIQAIAEAEAKRK